MSPTPPLPTLEELEKRYRDWWLNSFPFSKPAHHAVQTAAAFALELIQERETNE